MDIDTVTRDRDRPEQTVRRDVRVVVVNLSGADGTGEDIESDESNGRVVVLAVHRDVLAVHESHVRLERERGQARARSDTANGVEGQEPVEVCDLRGFGDVGERRSRRDNWEMMNEHAERHHAAGNRPWPGVDMRVALRGDV